MVSVVQFGTNCQNFAINHFTYHEFLLYLYRNVLIMHLTCIATFVLQEGSMQSGLPALRLAGFMLVLHCCTRQPGIVTGLPDQSSTPAIPMAVMLPWLPEAGRERLGKIASSCLGYLDCSPESQSLYLKGHVVIQMLSPSTVVTCDDWACCMGGYRYDAVCVFIVSLLQVVGQILKTT